MISMGTARNGFRECMETIQAGIKQIRRNTHVNMSDKQFNSFSEPVQERLTEQMDFIADLGVHNNATITVFNPEVVYDKTKYADSVGFAVRKKGKPYREEVIVDFKDDPETPLWKKIYTEIGKIICKPLRKTDYARLLTDEFQVADNIGDRILVPDYAKLSKEGIKTIN